MMNKTTLGLVRFLILGGYLAFAVVAQADSSAHVVIVVWDGMRPDFVTQTRTPNLWKMAQSGVTFLNHHSVYPTATEVNGTAISTGVTPGHSGLIANHEYRPEINPNQSVDTDNEEVIRKGDEVSGGKYLAVPTIAEIVRKAGKRPVIASTKTVGRLHDRRESGSVGERADTHLPFPGVLMPASAIELVKKMLGPFPREFLLPNVARDQWTTRALTEGLWRDGVPEFSLLWLSEPDLSQHDSSPGSDESLRALKSSDDNLALVLAALEKMKVRDQTDVMVVSDHGFSTISRSVDVVAALNSAGFHAASSFPDKPQPGDVMVVGNGGTVLLDIAGHDDAAVERVTTWLEQTEFAGAIFTKKKIAGALQLKDAAIESKTAPDIVFAFRWSEQTNQYGVPGEIFADAARAVGKGSHVTLSRYDLHNTLIAAGPHFWRGATDEQPTGNTDLAPTTLYLLGLKAPGKFDGRILGEALNNYDGPDLSAKIEFLEADRTFEKGAWQQKLRVSHLGATTYLDEARGGFTPK